MTRKVSHRLSALAGAAALTVGLVAGPVAADPVLVELFTSQGCSSCPPADQFLGELTKQDGVVALAFHVDYWDYIGWRDEFARPEHTARQKEYRDSLNLRTIYTPQMVIDGRFDAVGSQVSAVKSSIGVAAETAKLPLAIRAVDGKYRVTAPAAEIDQSRPASLWLAVFLRQTATPVTRGENAGSTLVEYNIVRELRHLGAWTGNAIDLELDIDAADKSLGCAVILQIDGNGPVLGVAAAPAAGQGT